MCRWKRARCSERLAPCRKCIKDGVLCTSSNERSNTPSPTIHDLKRLTMHKSSIWSLSRPLTFRWSIHNATCSYEQSTCCGRDLVLCASLVRTQIPLRTLSWCFRSSILVSASQKRFPIQSRYFKNFIHLELSQMKPQILSITQLVLT